MIGEVLRHCVLVEFFCDLTIEGLLRTIHPHVFLYLCFPDSFPMSHESHALERLVAVLLFFITRSLLDSVVLVLQL